MNWRSVLRANRSLWWLRRLPTDCQCAAYSHCRTRQLATRVRDRGPSSAEFIAPPRRNLKYSTIVWASIRALRILTISLPCAQYAPVSPVSIYEGELPTLRPALLFYAPCCMVQIVRMGRSEATMNAASLPYVEEDETIYSFCATAHALSGAQRADRTSLGLTGVPTSAAHHELPSSLQSLPLPKMDRQDSAFRWATAHTIAAFYVPFMTQTARELAAVTWFVGGPKARNLINRKVDGMRIEHPLKWCEECASSDVARIGRPYWHVAHQFPTTWVCTSHRRALRWVPRRHKCWILPTDSVCISETRTIEDTYAPVAALLATLGETIRSVPEIDRVQIAAFSEDKLRALGVLGLTSDIRSRLADWFRCSDLSLFLRTCPPGLRALADGAWITHHLQRPYRDHPVHCLLLWCAIGWPSADEAAKIFKRATAKRLPLTHLFDGDEEDGAAAFRDNLDHVSATKGPPTAQHVPLRFGKGED